MANVALVNPISLARVAISAAKARSLPARPSASAIAPSLAFITVTPRSKSSTRTRLWIAANIVGPPEGAPPRRQAFSLMTYSSDSLISPRASLSNTTTSVIRCCMLDGAVGWSAFFSNSTLPLSASIRMAFGASVS